MSTFFSKIFLYKILRSGAPQLIDLSASKSVCTSVFRKRTLFKITFILQLFHFTNILIRYKIFVRRLCFLIKFSFLCSTQNVSFYPCIVKNKMINYELYFYVIFLLIFVICHLLIKFLCINYK